MRNCQLCIHLRACRCNGKLKLSDIYTHESLSLLTDKGWSGRVMVQCKFQRMAFLLIPSRARNGSASSERGKDIVWIYLDFK